MQENKNDMDIEALIDESLKTPPRITLPGDFADRMAATVSRRFAWNQYFSEFLVYLGTFTGVSALFGIVVFYWMRASWHEWTAFITDNLGMVAGTLFLGLFILLTDRVLLRYFLFRCSGRFS